MGVTSDEFSQINNGRATIQNSWKQSNFKGSETQWVNTAWHVYKMPDVFPHLKPAPDGLTMNIINIIDGWDTWKASNA